MSDVTELLQRLLAHRRENANQNAASTRPCDAEQVPPYSQLIGRAQAQVLGPPHILLQELLYRRQQYYQAEAQLLLSILQPQGPASALETFQGLVTPASSASGINLDASTLAIIRSLQGAAAPAQPRPQPPDQKTLWADLLLGSRLLSSISQPMQQQDAQLQVIRDLLRRDISQSGRRRDADLDHLDVQQFRRESAPKPPEKPEDDRKPAAIVNSSTTEADRRTGAQLLCVLSGEASSRQPPSQSSFENDDSDDRKPLAIDKKKEKGSVSLLPSQNLSKFEPFPVRLHRLILKAEDSGQDRIISFTFTGRAFRIHKPQDLSDDILPRYFRSQHLSSFKRQLNLYGFERIPRGPEEGAFMHPLFRRDCPELAAQITKVDKDTTSRRKGWEPKFKFGPDSKGLYE